MTDVLRRIPRHIFQTNHEDKNDTDHSDGVAEESQRSGSALKEQLLDCKLIVDADNKESCNNSQTLYDIQKDDKMLVTMTQTCREIQKYKIDDFEEESQSSDTQWPELTFFPLLISNEDNNKNYDHKAALYDIQTDMNNLATTVKERQKPDIYIDLGHEDEHLPFFHLKFERLFGPFEPDAEMLDVPTLMVRQGGKICRYVREVRKGLPSYIFKIENTTSQITESFLNFYFIRREINSYYINMPTLTDGEVVKTLPILKDQILSLKFDETVLATNCYIDAKDIGSVVLFFERRAQYLEVPIKECLKQIFDPLVVIVILEYLDYYKFWQWKREFDNQQFEVTKKR
jgi:hypothetical protein